MRTLFGNAQFARFDLGTHAIRSRGVGQKALGQMEAPYYSDRERAQLLEELNAALAKVKPIEDLFAWSSNNDPGLVKYFGIDATRFRTLSNTIAPLYQTVRDLKERLENTDAEYWYKANADELAKVKQWVTGISEMYKMIQSRKVVDYTPAPGTAAPPPSVQAVPSAGGIAGISTETLLIGGGALVAVGLIAAALA